MYYQWLPDIDCLERTSVRVCSSMRLRKKIGCGRKVWKRATEKRKVVMRAEDKLPSFSRVGNKRKDRMSAEWRM